MDKTKRHGNTGKICSQETRDKIRKSLSESRKIHGIHRGHKWTEEQKKNYSELLKKKFSTASAREKLSKTAKECMNRSDVRERCRIASTGFRHSQLTKEKMRKNTLAFLTSVANQETSKKYAFISTRELQIKKILEIHSIKFKHQYWTSDIIHQYPADFYLTEYNIIIECDGRRWHNHPYGSKIDSIRNHELMSRGYRVIRVWDHQINEKDLIDRILLSEKVSQIVNGVS